MNFRIIRRSRQREQGELHWNARITDIQRQEIIEAVNAGQTLAAIATRYNITPGHVGRIYRKRMKGEQNE